MTSVIGDKRLSESLYSLSDNQAERNCPNSPVKSQGYQKEPVQKNKISGIDQVPSALIQKIFTLIYVSDFISCMYVSKTWKVLADQDFLWKRARLPSIAFDKEQWEKYFGDARETSYLPKSLLIFLPKSVNNALSSLITANKINDIEMAFMSIQEGSDFHKRYDDQVIIKSFWVLMTKKGMHNTFGLSDEDQQKLLNIINKQTEFNYKIPGVRAVKVYVLPTEPTADSLEENSVSSDPEDVSLISTPLRILRQSQEDRPSLNSES